MALLPEGPPTGGRPAREAAPFDLASPLPAGTITFLFTDIERSSQLWEQFPESMGEALACHDALLRRAIAANGGTVFKTMGDEFCAAFSTPIEALHAALQAQLA